MDEDITEINTSTRNEKIKSFFINNKKRIIIGFSILILLVVSYFTYGEINQDICPNGQLPYTIASALNLCLFPPDPACLDIGNGEYVPDHRPPDHEGPALNAPEDVWLCSHNHLVCSGPESNDCGDGNECVFNQWSYKLCQDSWTTPDGTPGGCCEYPSYLSFGSNIVICKYTNFRSYFNCFFCNFLSRKFSVH